MASITTKMNVTRDTDFLQRMSQDRKKEVERREQDVAMVLKHT